MTDNRTHITVILDRTGSMEAIRDDTIGGRCKSRQGWIGCDAGDSSHGGGDPAILDRGDERCSGFEREVLAAPEAQTLGISEVLDGGGPGRGDVDDPRIAAGFRAIGHRRGQCSTRSTRCGWRRR